MVDQFRRPSNLPFIQMLERAGFNFADAQKLGTWFLQQQDNSVYLSERTAGGTPGQPATAVRLIYNRKVLNPARGPGQYRFYHLTGANRDEPEDIIMWDVMKEAVEEEHFRIEARLTDKGGTSHRAYYETLREGDVLVWEENRNRWMAWAILEVTILADRGVVVFELDGPAFSVDGSASEEDFSTAERDVILAFSRPLLFDEVPLGYLSYMSYDDRRQATIEAGHYGQWLPIDANGAVITDDRIDWSDVLGIRFSERDSSGVDRSGVFQVGPMGDARSVVALRRDIRDGTERIVAFNPSAAPVYDRTTTSYLCAYTRQPNRDVGPIADLAPPVGEEYDLRVLLPVLHYPAVVFDPVTLPDLTFSTTDTVNISLHKATGGDDNITHTIAGLPPGLGFSAFQSGNLVDGTPTTPGIYIVTYTATDGQGVEASIIFAITVTEADVAVEFGTGGIANKAFTTGTPITSFTGPTPTAGNAPFTYFVNGLPDGINFDRATRRFSGTPNDITGQSRDYTVTYRARDSVGPNREAIITFTITLNSQIVPPAFAAGETIGTLTFVQGEAITPIQFPAVAQGTEPISYFVNSLLDIGFPPGLSFDGMTRTLSGTPTVAGTTNMEYEAFQPSDGGGEAFLTFTIRILASDTIPVFAQNTFADRSFERGEAITTLTLPNASGGNGELAFSMTGLPAGLTFDTTSRELAGTPTEVGAFTVQYVVADTDGDTDVISFQVTVTEPDLMPIFAVGSIRDQRFTVGEQITPFRGMVATGGDTPLTYTMTGLPAGLTFDAMTREVSGTPTTATDLDGVAVTYTATDVDGDHVSHTFAIIIHPPALSFGTATIENKRFINGVAITEFTGPVVTGGTPPYTYSIFRNVLPAGLSFDATTRTFSGTPTTVGTTSMVYVATDSSPTPLTVALSFSIDVEIRPVVLEKTAAVIAWEAIEKKATERLPDLVLPEATGGVGDITYSLRGPSLPRGVTFDPVTRTLSGRPHYGNAQSRSYVARDSLGSEAFFSLSLNVDAVLLVFSADPVNLVVPINQAMTFINIPSPTGGSLFNDGAYNFRLDRGRTNLPAGVRAYGRGSGGSYDRYGPDTTSNLPHIGGTPTEAGTFQVSYEAADADSDFTLRTVRYEFSITVYENVALVQPVNQTFTVGEQITALTLPEATLGQGDKTYTLTGIPDGLTFTPSTRVLSGTPSTTGTFTVTYTATDTASQTATQQFTITVRPNPITFTGTAIAAQSGRVGTAINRIRMRPFSGGTGPYTFAISGQPVGISLESGGLYVSGNPTQTGTFTITYTVTDSTGITGDDTFSITIAAALNLPAITNKDYVQNSQVNVLLPVAAASTSAAVYAVTGLPAGLSFSTTTRRITGSPTTVGTSTVTYTVTDGPHTDSEMFTIEVTAALALPSVSEQSFEQNAEITALQLPEATGGMGTKVYAVTGLPAGLSFSAATRQITGTPTATGTVTVSYTVTDDTGTITRQFAIEITLPPLFLPAVPDVELTRGVDVRIQLPNATGGGSSKQYFIRGLPAGLGPLPSSVGFSLTARERGYGGTPTDTRGPHTVVYEVTDGSSSVSVTFTITIIAPMP